ncbi:MAG: pantoate--beta-alanine ligase [Acidobacteriota bacterium]|nr:pantoate--beta-alanine ligase [Acidobacteriota bacterium]
MDVVRSLEAFRDLRRSWPDQGPEVCLVPTMGALHAGHLSLIEAAGKRSDRVVVSIFVNPTQFAPGEDFERYPRPLDRDLKELERLGVGTVLVPEACEMYPAGHRTRVLVEGLGRKLCGASRPTHFQGVATVVLKLFHRVRPQAAFFGQKDAQQSILIRRMVRDLDLDVEVVVCPTVREKDGLAVSSRNRYLSPEERKAAPVLFRSLEWARQEVARGERRAPVLLAGVHGRLAAEAGVRVDYAALVDPVDLETVDRLEGKSLLALAAFVGTTRLIDNTWLTS